MKVLGTLIVLCFLNSSCVSVVRPNVSGAVTTAARSPECNREDPGTLPGALAVGGAVLSGTSGGLTAIETDDNGLRVGLAITSAVIGAATAVLGYYSRAASASFERRCGQ
jgi:hypothetical protein